MIGVSFPVGDIDLTGRTISGIEYARQKIEQVLSLILGEWFLDQGQGIPWFDMLAQKNPPYEYIRGTLRRAISAVPGIVDVPHLSITEPDSARVSTITFRAIYKDGQPIDGQVTTPGILT